MADDAGDHETHRESLLEKIQGKIHGHDSSSSSDSEDEMKPKPMPAPVVDEPVAAAPVVDAPVAAPPVVDAPAAVASSSGKSKIYRLFGREQPVHKVLGGGKPADVLLWRNKKISASVLSVATVIWVLFELLEYHLLTLVCHILIFALVILFLWSNASTFIKKSPPRIPDVHIPENAVLEFASALRFEINRTLAVLREIASGKDIKKFIAVVAGLWVTSVIGSCVNFLTLIYILFVLLHTVPVLYEKYEDQVDTLAEKAASELKKHYAVVNEKVLSKIPRGLSRDKKMA